MKFYLDVHWVYKAVATNAGQLKSTTTSRFVCLLCENLVKTILISAHYNQRVCKRVILLTYPQRRGHNIVALDTNATVHSTVYFDTYGDASAGVKMHDHINSLPNGTIVLVATQDSAERYYHDALAALESIGAPKSLNLGLHSSWYLVGYKGEPRPAWVTQGYAGRGLGPSEVEMEIVTDVGGSK